MSDVHLGFTQYGLKRRAEDFVHAHKACLEIAKKNKVDFVVDCGDLLHSSRPNPDTMAYLRDVNAAAITANLPIYIVSGNHDAVTQDAHHWIHTVGGDNDMTTGGLKLADKKLIETPGGLKLFGIPHMSKEDYLQIPVPKCDIVLIHAGVSEFCPFSMLNMSDLPLDKCQMCLLGDIHINDVRNEKGCVVGYTGSTELNSASESEAKVCRIVEFRDGKYYSMEEVPIPTRSVVRLTLTDTKDMEDCLKDIQKEFKEAKRKPIVFFSFPPELPAFERFKSVLDPTEYILQPKLVSSKEKKGATVARNTSLTAVDYMKTIMRPATGIMKVAEGLLNPESSTSEVNEVLENFIAQQTA